jgi:hypothetical protein
MRIQPRQQILDVWRNMLSAAYRDGVWQWGGREESNSISDAEQLLCLLHPMHEIESFNLFDPDLIKDDVANALKPLGDNVKRIPRVLVDISNDYFTRHSTEAEHVADREPLFGGGSYFRMDTPGALPATKEQRDAIHIVDSYSLSITLCLAVLAFVKNRRDRENLSEYKAKLEVLGTAASIRLTAAMTGLLRSFVVNSMAPESEEGQAILSMLRQTEAKDTVLQRMVRDRFNTLRTQLRGDVRLAVAEETKPEDDQLFECGWTWGIAEGAQAIDFVDLDVAKKDGLALARPYLYFTVTALDGIVDLNTRRTRALDLLDPTQQRLADALQLRWDLTQRYWSAVARFDPENWPLEDIPWRTSDGEESDYYSLLVVSVLIQDLIARTASEPALGKATSILEELARRGRITRRLMDDDPALAVHFPGVKNRLAGSEQLGPELALYTYDYAPLLIKRSLQALQLTNNIEIRERLMEVAESAMDHLSERRLSRGDAKGLWDDVAGLREGLPVPHQTTPSWYLTERVIEALVTTATAYALDPPQSIRMYEHLIRLLNEADHIYNQEILEADAEDQSALRSGLAEIERLIGRARLLRNQRVSTGIALAERALRQLDELSQARTDAVRGH